MKPKSVLKFNGKPFDANAYTPALQQFIDRFKTLPKDEVFGTVFLAERWNMLSDTFQNCARQTRPALEPYRYKAGKDAIWGHPEAIAEYRRQVEAARGGK